MVYVIDINGNPMMPTERHGKVRRLLREGRAAVVRRTPFTIRLLYEVPGFVQDIALGVDAGSKTVGLSASNKTKELYRSEVTLRNDIVNLISTRNDNITIGRCVPRHGRSMHVFVPTTGGKRRSAIASHWIGKSRLQRFDTVRYEERECIISGSTNGRPILKNVDWTKATSSPSVNQKTVQFLSRKHGSIIYQMFNSQHF